MRFIQMLTGITVSYVLAACAAVQSYEGAALSDSETALITTSTRGDRDGVGYRSYFIAVDVDLETGETVADGTLGPVPVRP